MKEVFLLMVVECGSLTSGSKKHVISSFLLASETELR